MASWVWNLKWNLPDLSRSTTDAVLDKLCDERDEAGVTHQDGEEGELLGGEPGQDAKDGTEEALGALWAPQTQSPQTLPKTSFIQVPTVPPTSVSKVWVVEG